MRIDPSSFLFSSPLCISFSAPHLHFARCIAQTPSPPARRTPCICTTHASAARTLDRVSHHFRDAQPPSRPARKNVLFSALSPHISRRPSRPFFSAPPRAHAYTHTLRARISRFSFFAFTSSPTLHISLSHSELRVKALAFFHSPH